MSYMYFDNCRTFFLLAIVSGFPFGTANADLVADYAVVADGGNIVIDVLANDAEPAVGFDISSMHISSEATNGYLSIDANGRISYTHYGGPTTADQFSYVLFDNNGHKQKPAVVTIRIGDTVRDVEVGTALQKKRVAQPSNAVSRSTRQTMPAITAPPAVIGTENLNAFHRSGQTFITWRETQAGDHYHIYRHSVPITLKNLTSARMLTKKWGALGSDTSVNVYGGDFVPDNFVINDLESPLDDQTGLFVYTTAPSDSTQAYYALTRVRNGRELVRSLVSLDLAVQEAPAPPADILTAVSNNGSGRIYTQFMDYSRWNPTFNGYAYNYAVALPVGYNPEKKYPLFVELHAYSGQHKFAPQAQYGWQVIQLFPYDPGPAVGARHSWWYGYAADHDYRLKGIPGAGSIENFTEQRVLRAISGQLNHLPVDTDRIFGAGHSMGASGLLAMAIRYGSVFTGIYASEPMTNYRTSAVFADELARLWGDKSRNLSVVNRGWQSGSLHTVNEGVWDWTNHQQQLIKRRGTDIGYLMTFHGKRDNVIEWQTQGKPFVQALNDAGVGFSARYEEVGHSWAGFASVVESLFGFGYAENFPYKYPRSLSFPSIQRASGSGPLQPADTGEDSYNMNVEWATPHTPFAEGIVDKPLRYEITIRSKDTTQSADITPRRTQQFRVQPGKRCRYTATDSDRSVLSSGVVIADSDALLTVEDVSLLPGAGTRLIIDCRTN